MIGIFFTDIDGTLIDHDTYSFSGSIEGVELLRSHGIPLVPVSSKTFDEISLLMKELGLSAPFVFENGCGVAYPYGDSYRVEINGMGIQSLRKIIPQIEEKTGRRVIPLADLETDEICRLTGLSREYAILSVRRKASIPFILDGKNLLDDSEIAALNDMISAGGAELTKGGRFNHLIPAGTGKGEAVKKIIEFYAGGPESLLTAAAGDSMNDLPMLKAVDRGYIVRKKDGSFLGGVSGLSVVSGRGPEGFTEAVKDYLNHIMV